MSKLLNAYSPIQKKSWHEKLSYADRSIHCKQYSERAPLLWRTRQCLRARPEMRASKNIPFENAHTNDASHHTAEHDRPFKKTRGKKKTHSQTGQDATGGWGGTTATETVQKKFLGTIVGNYLSGSPHTVPCWRSYTYGSGGKCTFLCHEPNQEITLSCVFRLKWCTARGDKNDSCRTSAYRDITSGLLCIQIRVPSCTRRAALNCEAVILNLEALTWVQSPEEVEVM